MPDPPGYDATLKQIFSNAAHELCIEQPACTLKFYVELVSVDRSAPGLVHDPPAGHGPAESIDCGLLSMGGSYMTHSSIMPQTSFLKPEADYLAPDGSEIRLLPTVKGGGLCHCTLPAGKISNPVFHKNVEEIWYVIEGQGEIWRKAGNLEDIVSMYVGTSLTIPVHTSFQFRNTGSKPLCILIVTSPPWPGEHEAVHTVGKWPSSIVTM